MPSKEHGWKRGDRLISDRIGIEKVLGERGWVLSFNEVLGLSRRLQSPNGEWLASAYLRREIKFLKWRTLLLTLGCSEINIDQDPRGNERKGSSRTVFYDQNGNRIFYKY